MSKVVLVLALHWHRITPTLKWCLFGLGRKLQNDMPEWGNTITRSWWGTKWIKSMSNFIWKVLPTCPLCSHLQRPLFFLSFSTGSRYWSLLEAVYFHIRWDNLIQGQTSMLPSYLSSSKASTLSILLSLLLACHSGWSLHFILKRPTRSWGLTGEAFRDCDCVPLRPDRLSNH